MPEREFDGKVVLVTGGTGEIGRSCILEFAKQGANIAFVSRPEGQERAKLIIEEVQRTTARRQIKPEVLWIPADLAESEAPKAVVEAFKAQFSKLHVLVNNAGTTGVNEPINALTPANLDYVLALNLKAPMLLTSLFFRFFPRNEDPNIVNIASIVGLEGSRGQGPYEASKAGLIAFTKGASHDLAGRVRVNAIAPGFVDSEMTKGVEEDAKKITVNLTPVGRYGTGADIANAVLFLANPKSSFITGEVLVVDGGLRGALTAIQPSVLAQRKLIAAMKKGL